MSRSSATVASRRSASASAVAGCGPSATMTVNSSPPSRARKAPSAATRRRRAASRNSASPVVCPNTSLTSLNRSRSMHRTAKLPFDIAACSRADARCSVKAARLGRSVKASWCARCAIRSAARLRSVTSSITLNRYCGSPASSWMASRLVVTRRWVPSGVCTSLFSISSCRPDRSTSSSRWVMSSAAVLGKKSYTVFPIICSRGMPKSCSPARLIRT